MRSRGFTLVEVSIGMLMTGLIALAIAAFTSALTTQWHNGDAAQMMNVSAQQSRSVLTPIFQSARAIGGVFTTPRPAVFLWQFDGVDIADQTPQLCEMSLVEYDPATYTIYFYQADQAQPLSDFSTAMQTLTAADMQSASVASLFKSQSWLKPTRAILGPGRSVDSAIQIARVTAANFQNVSTSSAKQLNWTATLQRGDASLPINGLVTLRSPMAIP